VFSIRVLLRAFGDASIEMRNRGQATFFAADEVVSVMVGGKGRTCNVNAEDARYIESRYHLAWGERWKRSSRYHLPILNPESYVPDRVIPFDKIGKVSDTSGCVLTHLSDRRIDRLWNSPDHYFGRLKAFDCVSTPDFSLFLNMARPFIEYNALRSLMLGRRMQELGMRVLPAVMWAYPDTYDVCFEGIPRNSVVIVSTVGCVRRHEALKYFKMGMKAMLERVSPKGVVLYGSVPEIDFAVPVVRHFDRVSPTCFDSYQPDLPWS